MTCFWDGILASLNKDDFLYVGLQTIPSKKNFIKFLKHQNRKSNTKWQDNELTPKERIEHFYAVSSYDITSINEGHLTSSCDSFLLLLCDLFGVNIVHKFMNAEIHYDNPIGYRKILSFISDRGHFRKM